MAPLDLKYLVQSCRVNYSRTCKNVFVICMSYCDNCLYNDCSCIAGFILDSRTFQDFVKTLLRILGQFFLEL